MMRGPRKFEFSWQFSSKKIASRAAYIGALWFAGASAGGAVALADCTRITHISHAGEAAHADLGEGRVMYESWWSQEGSAKDMIVAECATGEALRFRVAEENMSTRAPFDRARDAQKIVANHHLGTRVFATLPRLADALDKVAKDITLTTETQETCACAALYPEMRGEKQAFALGG